MLKCCNPIDFHGDDIGSIFRRNNFKIISAQRGNRVSVIHPLSRRKYGRSYDISVVGDGQFDTQYVTQSTSYIKIHIITTIKMNTLMIRIL